MKELTAGPSTLTAECDREELDILHGLLTPSEKRKRLRQARLRVQAEKRIRVLGIRDADAKARIRRTFSSDPPKQFRVLSLGHLLRLLRK